MFAGYRHCKKCGKALMGLFDGALCDECEKEESRRMKNKDYEQLATKIMMNALEGVKAQIRKAYDKGYEDGKAATPFTDTEEAEKKAYNRGLAEAWECARKMCLMSSEERLRAFDVSGNHLAILSDLEATKALEKIKAYEERQKQTEDIKVGDEVRDDVYGHIGVVITDKPSLYDHRISVWFPDYSQVQLISINNLTKINRHFSQISEVQEELRGAENDE